MPVSAAMLRKGGGEGVEEGVVVSLSQQLIT